MNRRGFSLLEVMVSLGILAISLVAISGISAGSVAASEYARHLSVATLLARAKMIDVEEEMWKDGVFPTSDKELNGDFEKEGHPNYKWKASVRKIDVDIGQLVGSLLGEGVNQENLGEHVQGFLGALGGGGLGEGNEAAADQIAGSDLAKFMQGDTLEVLFKQVGQNLSESIREVELEITWGKKGVDLDSVRFVQYIVTTGKINTPRGVGQLPLGPGGQRLPGHRNANTSAIPPTLPGGGFNPASRARKAVGGKR